MRESRHVKVDWRFYTKDSWAYHEISRTRREARDSRTPHRLKPKYVWSLKVDRCPVLGIELDYTPEGDDDNSATLVMVDPSLGYVPNNVRVVSWQAARAERQKTCERSR